MEISGEIKYSRKQKANTNKRETNNNEQGKMGNATTTTFNRKNNSILRLKSLNYKENIYLCKFIQ